MARKRMTIIAAGIGTAAVLGLSGIAFAVFSSTTTATAGGKAAGMAPLTVDQGTKTDPNPVIHYANSEKWLWPNVGDSHVATVEIKVTNPNEVPVKVEASGISGTAGFYGPPGKCPDSLLKVTDSVTLIGGPVTVPANKGTATITVKGLYLDQEAPNQCQNRPFHTTWTITGSAL